MTRVSQTLAFLFASITLSMFTVAPAIAEGGTVEAFSSWQARGQFYPTGTAEATFVGALFGILYVKNKDGSFDTGRVTCPAVMTINTTDGSQSGQGRCVILTPGAERIYSEFKCSGVAGSGCNGNLEFKGGTGAKENITGGGPIQFKAAFMDMMAIPGNIVNATYAGIAVLPKLTYNIP